MNASNLEPKIIHFDKKFGFITQNKLMLTQGNSEDLIPFESIEKVNLIKYRVLFTNIILVCISCLFIVFSTFFLKADIKVIYTFIVIGILLLIFSIVHKFYFYRVVIKEKNNTTHVIKTSQINRKCIKQFYLSLLKKVGKKK